MRAGGVRVEVGTGAEETTTFGGLASTGMAARAACSALERLHGVPEVEGLLNGVRRRHVVVEEGVAHIVLKQGPQARSTTRKRKMHDIANKFVDGRHGTSPGWSPTPPFFIGELAGELLPAFFSSQLVCALITCLECKGNSKSEQ
jgi:hypothetical protein